MRGTTPIRSTFPAFLLVILLAGAGCSPVYLARAGWAQAKILASRESLVEVMVDPATDPVTVGKLRLVYDARLFAIEDLGFQNAGDSYTTVARLPSDTLALVLSAAYRDRLAFRTWWFPIVGRMPYRGYFSEESALQAQSRLERDGFDTWLRPTSAFSTLGWFADPLYSTLLRLDEVALVETVLHELAHNHLFVPGQGRFNESFANFVGARASIEFFCTREGGGMDSVKCNRARNRWADMLDVSVYLMALEEAVREVYAMEELDSTGKLARRDTVYAEGLERFRGTVQPGLRASSYAFLASGELNNATLLARTLYYHRLPDFQRLFEERGEALGAVLAFLREAAPGADDPFDLLPGRGR